MIVFTIQTQGNLMKKQLLLTLLTCSGILHSATEKKSFIIKQAPIKESVNTLKEQVGTSVQAALKEITTLQEKASQLLAELASTQRQLLKAGSSILHEKEPFKKASKESLVAARDNVKQLRSHVTRSTATINSWTQKPLTSLLATTTCLGIKKTSTT